MRRFLYVFLSGRAIPFRRGESGAAVAKLPHIDFQAGPYRACDFYVFTHRCVAGRPSIVLNSANYHREVLNNHSGSRYRQRLSIKQVAGGRCLFRSARSSSADYQMVRLAV